MRGMFYFGIADDLAGRLLNALEETLKTVFGNAVTPLFDDFFGNIGTFLIEYIWNWLVLFLNRFFYNTFVVMLFILDLISSAFDIFIGMKDIVANTETGAEDSLFNVMFYSGGISRAFWGISIIACILTIAFTIFAVMRSMMDLEVKRPVGNILRLMSKSILTFLLIPFITIAGLNLASLTLSSAARLISGGGNLEDVSIGTFVYVAVSEDAMRTHTILPEEVAIEMAGEATYNMVALVINPLGRWIEIMIEQLWDTATRIANFAENYGEDRATNAQMYAIEKHVTDDLRLTLDTPEADRVVRDGIKQYFYNGGDGSAVTRALNALGLPRMPYLDSAYVKQFVKINLVHSMIGCIVTICVGIFMFMGAFIFARRIFEILLLYIVSPFFAATIPLDDGAKFKAWREQFIGKVVSGYGIVISVRIFLLMVPVIFSSRIQFTKVPFLDEIIRLIVLCASAASVLKAHTLITQITGGGSSAEAEASALGQKGFSIAMTPVTTVGNYVGGAISSAASSAANQAFSAISQRISPGAQSSLTSMSESGGMTSITGNVFTGASPSGMARFSAGAPVIGGHRMGGGAPVIGGHRMGGGARGGAAWQFARPGFSGAGASPPSSRPGFGGIGAHRSGEVRPRSNAVSSGSFSGLSLGNADSIRPASPSAPQMELPDALPAFTGDRFSAEDIALSAEYGGGGSEGYTPDTAYDYSQAGPFEYAYPDDTPVFVSPGSSFGDHQASYTADIQRYAESPSSYSAVESGGSVDSSYSGAQYHFSIPESARRTAPVNPYVSPSGNAASLQSHFADKDRIVRQKQVREFSSSYNTQSVSAAPPQSQRQQVQYREPQPKKTKSKSGGKKESQES